MGFDRLLALDLDGTLLRTDGTIDPRDVAAIERARAAGCAVTLATGRVTAATIAVARALRLDVPLVCADGRIVAHPESGATEELFAVPSRTEVITVLREHTLAALHFTPMSIVHELGAARNIDWVDALAERIECDVPLEHAICDDAVMLVGLGPRPQTVKSAAVITERLGAAVQVDLYPLGDGPHAVRVWAAGHDKHTGLSRVAARLGIATARVAVVGDWFNDIGMMRWAGRSFAMGWAPAEVIAAATEVLDARAGTGGGVAEAIDRWYATD